MNQIKPLTLAILRIVCILAMVALATFAFIYVGTAFSARSGFWATYYTWLAIIQRPDYISVAVLSVIATKVFGAYELF